MSRWGRTGAGALLAMVTWFAAMSVPAASVGAPTLQVSKTSAAPGDQVIVTLGGWPSTVTVAVCGNEARRGSVDCDQTGAVGVPASALQPQQRELTLTTPPVKCPCVIRAATAGEQEVVTEPIELVGVARAPVTGPDRLAAQPLGASARVMAGSSSLVDRLKSSLGGPTQRVLVLTLTNRGSTPVSGITVTAAVARSAQGGEPLQPPDVEPLAPGETRPYTLRVTLSAPAYGSYVVFGSVYGPGPPVGFAVRTRTTPWTLIVLGIVLVADVVAITVLRFRRRDGRPPGSLPGFEPRGTTRETPAEHLHP